MKKEIGDLQFFTLIMYFYDGSGRTPNLVFPIDVTPFELSKAERLGFKV